MPGASDDYPEGRPALDPFWSILAFWLAASLRTISFDFPAPFA